MSEPLPHDYQTVPVVPVRHFACLACGEHLFHVEHLFKSVEQYDKGDGHSAGPWYCDECGTAHELRVYADGRVTARALDKKCLPTSVVLKLPPQKEPVYFLMEGMRFTEEWPNPGETQAEQASFDALVNAGVPEEALARMSLRDQIAEKEAELIRRSNLIEEKEREINRLREQIRDTENRR